MKIALAQIEVIAGRPEKNTAKMLLAIEEAKQKQADLIVFPEMCIGGYLIGDDWNKDSVVLDFMQYGQEIIKASKGIGVAFGNVYGDSNEEINKRTGSKSRHPNNDGRMRKYNAAWIFQDGKPAARAKEQGLLPMGVQPKTLLPNYRFFDDKRYFFSLKDVAEDFGKRFDELLSPYLIKVKGKEVKVGFELCEDLWCEDYRYNDRELNPTRILIENGAEIIINLSASPWTYGKNGARDRRIQFLKRDFGKGFVPFLYVNCVGAQNNGKNIITFDGGSTVYNTDGEPIIFSKGAYKEELIIIDTDELNKAGMLRKEDSKIAQKYFAIIKGIKHLKDISGRENHPKYVIGLSGGVDSSIVAALMVQAVGKENVIGINMPTKYNSEQTKQAAAGVAKELGIKYLTIPIGEIVKVNEEVLKKYLETENFFSIVAENLQAKIRGTTVLSNAAAQLGALFTNNGNKIEIATGYATLYGDVGGAIAPIGDLTKAEVFEMAKYLNEQVFKREVIPKILLPSEMFKFELPPTAELKDKQIDPFKWGYHDALLEALTNYRKKTMEDICGWYIEGKMEENLGISYDLLDRWGVCNPAEFLADLEDFCKRVKNNVFKRVQAPPIIIVSKSAYGYDIRESQMPFILTQRYFTLKKQILRMKIYEKKS